jgi:hypothetical protein
LGNFFGVYVAILKGGRKGKRKERKRRKRREKREEKEEDKPVEDGPIERSTDR